MRRWTANFLLLVMLVPGFAPLALARTAAPEAMHCLRVRQTEQAAQPAMPCHHGMAEASPPPSTEASVGAFDCCGDHDCCRGQKTSEWARPASIHFSFVSLVSESAVVVPVIIRASADVIAPDSARAPPNL
jgi:hypothetical protein